MKQLLTMTLTKYDPTERDSIAKFKQQLDNDELAEHYKDHPQAKEMLESRSGPRTESGVLHITDFTKAVMDEWLGEDSQMQGVPAGIVLKPSELKALGHVVLEDKIEHNKQSTSNKLDKLRL